MNTNKNPSNELTPEQYEVLRCEGTERPFTSPLLKEKRTGMFVCAGCGLELFDSKTKYDSGTGWPSFFEVLPDNVKTTTDTKLGMPRTEYHCARCGGHQGHVFNDGPNPTGLRYCNNGVALKFVEASRSSGLDAPCPEAPMEVTSTRNSAASSELRELNKDKA